MNEFYEDQVVKTPRKYIEVRDTTVPSIKEVYGAEGTNRKRIGDIWGDVDGSYYFWFQELEPMGAFSSYILGELAEVLEEMNKPWEDMIQKMLDKDKQNEIQRIDS